MKKIIVAFGLTLCISALILAQPPQAFKYQAVVRDNTGEILQNQQVDIRISIRNVWSGGTILYQETFTENTNNYGLVNLEVGNGTTTLGIFSNIQWGADKKFIEIEIDADGGGYISMGTLELLSVPYALYAENTANGDNLGNHTATQDIDLNNYLITGDGGVNIDSASADGVFINKAGDPANVYPASANNGFEVAGAEDHGLFVGYAGVNGLHVNTAEGSGLSVFSTGWNGVSVSNAGNDGINVTGAGNPSTFIPSSEKNGFEVAGAEGHGLYVGRADVNGIKIDASGSHGVFVNNAGYCGIYVNNSYSNGIWIQNSGNSGLKIEDPAGSGISILDASSSGLVIDSPLGNGISISNPGVQGLQIGHANENGIILYNTGADGVHINDAGDDGIHIEDAGSDGIRIIDPAENGISLYGEANRGVYIENSVFGIDIDNSSVNGVSVTNADGIGVMVNNAGNNGFYVHKAGNPSTTFNTSYSNGLEVCGSEGYGLYVGRADQTGVYVNSTGDDGVVVIGAHHIGLYGKTTSTIDEWGVYTPDKLSALNVTSKGNSTYAKNTGNSILEPGDVVCIAGGTEENVLEGWGYPVINISKADNTNSQAVFGVVEYNVAIREKEIAVPEGEAAEIRKSFGYTDGNISPGDYLSVIVFGQAEVKVNEAVNAGDALVAGNGGARKVITTEVNGITIAENTGILGKALEDSNGKDKIKVFVNCK